MALSHRRFFGRSVSFITSDAKHLWSSPYVPPLLALAARTVCRPGLLVPGAGAFKLQALVIDVERALEYAYDYRDAIYKRVAETHRWRSPGA
jgi:hypothetical protein